MRRCPQAQRLEMGLTDSLLRLSVGVEEVDDLLKDLDQALKAVTRLAPCIILKHQHTRLTYSAAPLNRGIACRRPSPPPVRAAPFPASAPSRWEHPADRAALQTLRSVPGAEEVIKKILAMIGGERGIRLLFQGNAVRVGPEQYPRLWTLHTEVCTTFDWEKVPELYVSQTPFVNAGAYGIDEPFIVLHSVGDRAAQRR